MNSGGSKIRKNNPKENANIFSILFVGYAFKTIGKGYRNDLEDDDIYQVLKTCESDKLGDRLEKEWEKELKTKNPSLLKAIFTIFGSKYILLGFIIFTYETTLAIILEPLLVGKVTSYFEPGSNMTKSEATLYTLGLTGCSLMLLFCNNQYLLTLLVMCLQIRISTASLIYRKCLKLNVNFASNYVGGKPITLITKDILQFYEAADCAQMIVVGIPQFFVMIIITYNHVGIAAIAGASLIIFTLPINASNSKYGTGNVVTLITKNILPFVDAADCGHMLVIRYPRVFVITYIMYRMIGVAALYGTAAGLILISFNVYLGKLTSQYRLKTAEKTDQRVRLTQEILTAMRIVKMYTWERFFSKSVSKLRKREIRELRILFYIKAMALSFGQLSSRFAFYICVMTYIALGNHITAEKAFVVTGCFGALRAVLTTFMPLGIAQMAELKASLHRITTFLMLEEVPENHNTNYCEEQIGTISIRDATIKTEKGVTILDALNLDIMNGLTLVMGPTGSGKSTLLKLLLGDIPTTNGTVGVCGKMSYASQEPWLFPATVRQNITFGEWFDENRYQKVIEVCALKQDMEAFPEGDRTCVTDRGLNLSKGQKARINLARAIYKKADIYLLDDCLSSVDSRVGKHIFYQCIKGFLRDHICVLITHNSHVLEAADHLLILNKGCLKFNGNFNSFKQWDDKEVKSILNHTEIRPAVDAKLEHKNIADDIANADEFSTLLKESPREDTNIYQETKQVGKVNKAVYFAYFTSGGGLKMISVVALFCVVAQVTSSWSDYFVSFWVDMEQELSGFRLNETTNSTEYKKLEDSHDSVMKLYSFVMLATAIFTILRAFTFYIFSSKASTHIHKSVLERILNTGMIFFDNNLSGNVLNRFSRDLAIIDEQMPNVIFECSSVILSILAVLFVVSSVNLFFIIPSIIFTIVLYFARRLYMPTGRSLRRLEGSTRSPVVGHLNATLEGLTTIRASQAQNILKKEFDKHQDLYSSVVYMNLATTRAFGFYIDMTCAIYITVITLSFLFFKTDTLAGKVGLAITQSFSLTGLLQWGVRQWAELENQMTSTERVLEYRSLPDEQKSGTKFDNWPDKGIIEYQNVNLKYAEDNERVLKNINFIIDSRQKIGIVGRTGAGKTSIISTLFRMYGYEGTITIDNVDIQTVAIDYLRSKISIIPQDPVLFSGTVRSNLDPYGDYEDKILWEALDEVEMKNSFQSLDATIYEGGSDLSVGERQMLCLARAVVRNNNILILDEATANIDPETDALVQRTIKRRFSDCTVITIAHRLHTVLDSDKIFVMDAAEIVECGPPKVLVEDTNGVFYCMVKEAGLL